MELQCSVPCTQEVAAGPYPQPTLSSPHTCSPFRVCGHLTCSSVFTYEEKVLQVKQALFVNEDTQLNYYEKHSTPRSMNGASEHKQFGRRGSNSYN